MSASPFICNVEGSEESLKPAGSSRRQLKHQVCSYTLLLVLVGVLAVLVLALTGGVIWMKLFQDRPEKLWTVGFSGRDTNFTSPGTQKYKIFGRIFTKENASLCNNTFRLLQKVNKTESVDDISEKVAENFFKNNVELKKGATLSVWFNCVDMNIDEVESELFIYQHNS